MDDAVNKSSQVIFIANLYTRQMYQYPCNKSVSCVVVKVLFLSANTYPAVWTLEGGAQTAEYNCADLTADIGNSSADRRFCNFGNFCK